MLAPLNGTPPDSWGGVIDTLLVIQGPGLLLLAAVLVGIRLLGDRLGAEDPPRKSILYGWVVLTAAVYLIPTVLIAEPWEIGTFKVVLSRVFVLYSIFIALWSGFFYWLIRKPTVGSRWS